MKLIVYSCNSWSFERLVWQTWLRFLLLSDILSDIFSKNKKKNHFKSEFKHLIHELQKKESTNPQNIAQKYLKIIRQFIKNSLKIH